MKKIKKFDRYEYLVQLLYEYIERQSTRYENDVIQLDNNVMYRTADPLDHLEMIMAKTRLFTADKVFGDLRFVIALSKRE